MSAANDVTDLLRKFEQLDLLELGEHLFDFWRALGAMVAETEGRLLRLEARADVARDYSDKLRGELAAMVEETESRLLDFHVRADVEKDYRLIFERKLERIEARLRAAEARLGLKPP